MRVMIGESMNYLTIVYYYIFINYNFYLTISNLGFVFPLNTAFSLIMASHPTSLVCSMGDVLSDEALNHQAFLLSPQ